MKRGNFLLQRLNRFPPNLCRLLARKQRGRLLMTNTDIATVAGMSRALVSKIAAMSSWENVTLSAAQRFSLACGVNLLSPCKQVRFWRRRSLHYQKNATSAQRRMMDRIVRNLWQPR